MKLFLKNNCLPVSSPQGGYIALISVIIVSLLLITVITALSTVNYFSRYNILENEYKERSSGLAEGCVDYALGKLAANSAYTVASPQSIAIGSDTCNVMSVVSQSGQTTIVTQGFYPATTPLKSYTKLTVIVDSNINNSTYLQVISWQETP